MKSDYQKVFNMSSLSQLGEDRILACIAYNKWEEKVNPIKVLFNGIFSCGS